MRTQILTLIIITLSLTVYSQNYHKLLRTNTYWDDHFISYPNIGCHDYAQRKFIDNQDTLIDGYTYFIIKAYPFHSQNPLFCPPFTIDTISYPTYYYLREDTIAKKVFINLNEGDQILYDFSLLPGDTLNSTYTGSGMELILDTIVNIGLLNGEIRKKFIFHSYTYDTSFYIESIGGSNGLCEPINSFEWDGGFFCVKENSVNLWGDECDYWFVNVPKNEDQDIIIFPNPSHGLITVSLPDRLRISSFKVFNSAGKLIRAIHLTSSKTEVNLEDITPGIYFYQISNSSNFVTGKLSIF